METNTERPSKTRRKQQASAVQDLGAILAELKPALLARVPLSTSTLDAIIAHSKTKTHEARRRQMQRIGKLMRDEDEIAVRSALIEMGAVDVREQRRFRLAQTWRDRLLRDGVEGLEALAEAQRGLSIAQRGGLTELLARNADQDPDAVTELFQMLHRMMRV